MAGVNQKQWDQVTEAVRRLEGMTLQQIRAEWSERYGAPPKLRSVDLLARLLSWRMQADCTGGLDPTTIKKLQHKTVPVAGPRLTPGVRIEREWRGVRESVEVVEGGFRWKGQTGAVRLRSTFLRWV